MSEMTPELAREHHLSRIRAYAIEHDLSGEDIALIFETGIAAAAVLRAGPPPAAEEVDRAA